VGKADRVSFARRAQKISLPAKTSQIVPLSSLVHLAFVTQIAGTDVPLVGGEDRRPGSPRFRGVIEAETAVESGVA
jgi:hypothetical protein